MAKFVYIGSASASKRVRSIYLGVSSASRAVTKAYVGVGGVAKQFWPRTGKYSPAYGGAVLVTTRIQQYNAALENFTIYRDASFDESTGLWNLSNKDTVTIYYVSSGSVGLSGYYGFYNNTMYALVECTTTEVNLFFTFRVYGKALLATQNY